MSVSGQTFYSHENKTCVHNESTQEFEECTTGQEEVMWVFGDNTIEYRDASQTILFFVEDAVGKDDEYIEYRVVSRKIPHAYIIVYRDPASISVMYMTEHGLTLVVYYI